MSDLFASDNIEDFKSAFLSTKVAINAKVEYLDNYWSQKSMKKKRRNPKAKECQQNISIAHEYIWKELPLIIKSRLPSYITKKELQSIMEYKLGRGQFRFSLLSFIDRNADKTVIEVSTCAFSMIDEFSNNLMIEDLEFIKKCITQLSKLSGVGCATASLILAIYTNNIPFMSDECMKSVGLSLKYTLKHYLLMVEKLVNKCQQLLSLEQVIEGNVNGLESKDIVFEEENIIGSKISETLESKVNEMENNGIEKWRITPFHISEGLWAEYVLKDMKVKMNKIGSCNKSNGKCIGKKRKSSDLISLENNTNTNHSFVQSNKKRKLK